MCPPKREFNPHPRSLAKETLKQMALERANPRAAAESLTQIDSSLSQQKSSPKSFRPSGNIKPLKKITKLTPEQLEKGKLVAASYKLNELDKIAGGEEDVFETRGQGELEGLGLGDFTLDTDLSTDQFIVVDKGNKTKLVFRGRAAHILVFANNAFITGRVSHNLYITRYEPIMKTPSMSK